MNLTDELIDKIVSAFKDREKPDHIIGSDQLSEMEREEVDGIYRLDRYDISCSFLDEMFEVFYWLSPHGFCYYLPGALVAGVKDQRVDLLLYDSLINMLDRSPNPDYWDSFFSSRWCLLTSVECESVQDWFLWYISACSEIDDSVVERVFDTLELLKTEAESPSNGAEQ